MKEITTVSHPTLSDVAAIAGLGAGLGDIGAVAGRPSHIGRHV